MKQALKWLGIIAVVLLMLVVLAVLILTPLANRRQQAFRPLSDETLQQVLSSADKDHSETGYTMPAASGSTGSDATAVDSRDASQDNDSGDQSSSAIPSRPELRLARTLTREDIIREFRPGHIVSPNRLSQNIENIYRNTRTGALKLMESAAWAADSDRAEGFALEIGSSATSRGDIEEACNYMREALEISVRRQSNRRRHSICAQLAWVEQDPEVAATLLEASCSLLPHPSLSQHFLPHRLQDALCLAILTDSDELANYYYARWDVLEPEEKTISNGLIGLGGSHKIEEWLRQRNPDFYRNSTDWDPMQ